MRALQQQVAQLVHTSNHFVVPLQEALAEKLCALSGLHRVFFCNSGLEANEAALKIARKYGHSRGIEHARIIVFEGAFHGRSIATLSASGNAKVQAGFGPLLDGFVRLPLNDTQALQAAASHDDIVAVLLEPIQGEGGIRRVEDHHLRAIAAQCRANGWLLMLDEVQCGMGRTGRWFAHQRPAVDADVVLLAKGLASGVPIGAVLCSERAAAVMGPGSHGSTFGGNPLAMRAALETIAVIEEEDLLSRVRLVGHIVREQLWKRLGRLRGVEAICGEGLMIGIVLDRPCGTLVQMGTKIGLLIGVTAERVVRILPPLILTATEGEEIAARVCSLIEEFLQDNRDDATVIKNRLARL